MLHDNYLAKYNGYGQEQFGQTPGDQGGQGSLAWSMGWHRVGYDLVTEQQTIRGLIQRHVHIFGLFYIYIYIYTILITCQLQM